jgi:hypothetical protein
MEFDYYALYKDWPTLDLVRVARTPNDYAPDAVSVAKQILWERGVSLEEMDAAEWELAQAEMAAAIGRPRIGDYIERITEVFRPERGDGSASSPPWFQLLLVCYGIYYTVNIYSIIRYMVWLHRCIDCVAAVGAIVWDICFAAYLTLCIYLLLKQKRLGWALLFVQAVALGCGKLPKVFNSYEHHLDLTLLFPYQVLPLLIYCGIGVLLCRPAVLGFFDIPDEVKKRVWLVGTTAGILMMIIG